ncbi:MAG TPA: exopolysaccharide biosynthesis protein [Methyloceanibacter sp.]
MDDTILDPSRATAADRLLRQHRTASPPATIPATPSKRRTSTLLREFLAQHSEPRVSLGALRDALADRGFGVLLFIFALPNLIPVNIPLLSAVLGLPLVLLAAQLSYGRHKPWFPHWLTHRSFPHHAFIAVVERALPGLERTEMLLRPRLSFILSWTGERIIGFAVLILALVLTAPIPFGNWLPACAIAIVGLAIVEKDGLATLAGLAVGAVSLFVAGTVVLALIKGFLLLFGLG